jgi:hypothetical protein
VDVGWKTDILMHTRIYRYTYVHTCIEEDTTVVHSYGHACIEEDTTVVRSWPFKVDSGWPSVFHFQDVLLS